MLWNDGSAAGDSWRPLNDIFARDAIRVPLDQIQKNVKAARLRHALRDIIYLLVTWPLALLLDKHRPFGSQLELAPEQEQKADEPVATRSSAVNANRSSRGRRSSLRAKAGRC